MAREFQVGFVFGGRQDPSFDGAVKGVKSALKGLEKAVVGIGAAIGGTMAIKDAIGVYTEWEQGIAGVKAVSGATVEQLEELKQASLSLKNAGPKDATEALEAMTAAGWDVDKSIKGLEPMINLATAGQLDLADASSLATNSMATMGIEVDQMTWYLDKATVAGSASNASTADMLESYSRVGGSFTNLNTSLDESGALFGVLANRGTTGAEAGTALNTIISRITNTSGEASKAFHELGIDVYDTQGNFRGLETIFGETNEALSGLTEEQQNSYRMMISGKGSGATKALGDVLSGLGEEYFDIKEQIANADGAMAEMADTMSNTTQGAMKRFSVATDKLKIAFVETFAGPMAKGIDFVAEKIPILTGGISQGIGWIKEKGNQLIPVWERIKEVGIKSFSALKSSFMIVSPYLIEFKDFVVTTGENIATSLGPKIEWVATVALPKAVEVSGSLLNVSTKLGNFIENNWSKISPIIAGIVAGYTSYKAISLGVEIAEKARAIATSAVATAQTYLNTVNATGTATQWSLNAAIAANPIGAATIAIGGLIAIGVALYQNWDVIKVKAGELWQAIQGAFGGMEAWFSGIWSGIKTGFKGFINYIIGGLNKIPEGLNSLNVKIPDWIPGAGGKTLGFNIPSIPMLASGGVAVAPTLAMVGEGKEQEAILPLSKLQSLLDGVQSTSIATLIRSFLSSGGQTSSPSIVYAPNITVPPGSSKEDFRDILEMDFQKFKRFMKQYEKDKSRKGMVDA